MHASAQNHAANDQSIQHRMNRAFEFSDLSQYSFKDRLLIRAADIVFYCLIKLIGATVRFEVIGWENHEKAERNGGLPIYTIWHEGIFLMAYFWRNRRIVVMNSHSFDAEHVVRFLKRFGYGSVRGSSTRGGLRAMLEMLRLMRAGCPAALTIDGPKGPRYVAKRGAVLLAKQSGHPIMPMSVAPARFWKVSSWDQLQIPKPFTRARVYLAPPIYVPAEADEQTLTTKHDELQQVLDLLTRQGNEWRQSLTP
jgi:lysophospholipid acyltransferase (LPLAT)-like uncharacterized protein